MPAPNPIWGLHVTPGSAVWAKVRREADGSFRVLDWSMEALPGTAAEAVQAAAGMLQRRGVKGYGVVVAVPDDSGCLVTARLTAEELDLHGDDLARELHEHTPFEPEAASLRMLFLRADGRRRVFLVSALPVAQDRVFQDALLASDDGTRGIGFASAASWRGAVALGLGSPPYFLVDVHAHTTTVTAFETTRVRRYLIASGYIDCAGETERIDAVAADVRNIAEYHRKLAYAPNDPPADAPELVFFPCGRALADPSLRNAMAKTLGETFGAARPFGEPGASIRFDKDPGEQLPGLVGAIGAALEGFEAPDGRIALRQLPADIATPSEPIFGGARAAFAVAGLALAATAVWWFGFRDGAGDRPADAPSATDRKTAAPTKSQGPVADVTRRACYAAAIADASAVFGTGAFLDGSLELRWSDAGYAVTLTATPLDAGTAESAVRGALADRSGAAGVAFAAAGTGDAPADAVRASWRRPAAICPDPASLDDAAKSRVGSVLSNARTARTTRPRGETTANGAWTAAAPLARGLAPLLEWAPEAGPDLATWTPGRVTISDGTVPALAAGPVDAAAIDAILTAAAASDLPARLAPLPASMTELRVDLRGESCAALSWRAGIAGRRLVRTAGTGDSAAGWSEVAVIGAAAGSAEDWLAAPGVYRYRIEHATGAGSERSVTCAPVVQIEPDYVFPGGGVAFRLTRMWKDGPVTETASVSPGGAIRTEKRVGADVVVLDAGRTLHSPGRVVQTEESVEVRLPRFLPDGRVERDAAGSPRLETKRVPKAARVLEADLAAPDGTVTKVSRKMTDG